MGEIMNGMNLGEEFAFWAGTIVQLVGVSLSRYLSASDWSFFFIHMENWLLVLPWSWSIWYLHHTSVPWLPWSELWLPFCFWPLNLSFISGLFRMEGGTVCDFTSKLGSLEVWPQQLGDQWSSWHPLQHAVKMIICRTFFLPKDLQSPCKQKELLHRSNAASSLVESRNHFAQHGNNYTSVSNMNENHFHFNLPWDFKLTENQILSWNVTGLRPQSCKCH